MRSLYLITIVCLITWGCNATEKQIPPAPILPCLAVSCAPCQFGYVILNGCPTCICQHPCAITRCSTGTYCLLLSGGLTTCCPYPTCPVCQYGVYVSTVDFCRRVFCCPLPVCPICPSRMTYNVIDRNGCLSCGCLNIAVAVKELVE